MTLRVHTDAVRAAAHRLDDLGADSSSATSYADSEARIEKGAGDLFGLAGRLNDKAADAVGRTLAQARHVLEASSVELRGVARMYDDTDHDQANRMDGEIAKVPPLADGQHYSDVEDDPVDTVPSEEPTEIIDLISGPSYDDGDSSGGGGQGGGSSW